MGSGNWLLVVGLLRSVAGASLSSASVVGSGATVLKARLVVAPIRDVVPTDNCCRWEPRCPIDRRGPPAPMAQQVTGADESVVALDSRRVLAGLPFPLFADKRLRW